jgi:hypothetical protein
MRPNYACFGTLLLAVFAPPARADGVLYRLPEDGAWVRFDVTMTLNEADGDQGSGTGSLTMSSVGRTQLGGEDCRWIEFHLHTTVADGAAKDEDDMIAKVLIPEKHLNAGNSPFDHLARGWLKWENNDPVELRQAPFGHGSLAAALLAGPPEDAKKLDKQRVQSKLGELDCEGTTGTATFEDGESRLAITDHTRLHEKAPFGVVACRMDFKVSRNGQVQSSGTMALKLADLGTGAESELPGQR